jgi:hypothetical protein
MDDCLYCYSASAKYPCKIPNLQYACVYISRTYLQLQAAYGLYVCIYYIERERARECAHTGTEGVTLCCGGIYVCTYIYICIDIERERARVCVCARVQAQRAAHSAAGTCRALIEP